MGPWRSSPCAVGEKACRVLFIFHSSFSCMIACAYIPTPLPPLSSRLWWDFSLFPPALLLRWLYGKTVCSLYAFCGMLFGICSLTTLTLLSTVCFVKVCYPFYGKPSKTPFPTPLFEMTRRFAAAILKWLLVDFPARGRKCNDNPRRSTLAFPLITDEWRGCTQ